MMTSMDICDLPLRELARRVANAELSAVEVASAYIRRIDAGAAIHAWQHFDPEAVLRQARAVDARGGDPLPLAGVPVGVKDLLDTADMPTTYGSPVYAGHVPAQDAACVAQARRLGAVVMGKTVTTEFAAFQPGPTRNPRSPSGTIHTPGGSSSGSAAAVAAGMVPVAFGTQTAGSIVRPAAFCGIVGYKPTSGLISAVGIKALAPGLDTVGVLARRVDDAACFVSALTRWPLTPQPIAGLRVGLCRTPWWDLADGSSQRAVEGAADLFRQLGATMLDITLPLAFHGLNEAQMTIMDYEAAASFESDAYLHADGFSPSFAQLLDRGAKTTGADYVAARHLATRSRRDLADLFSSVDVLLAPSTRGEAPVGLEATGDPLFNRMWTLLGNPCVHLPTGQGDTGMPVGVTLIGPMHQDGHALSAAWMLERG